MNLSKGRSILWFATALLFITTVVVGAGVIPIAGIYSSPYVRSEVFITICWIYLGFSCIAAAILGFIAACARHLSLFLGTLLATAMLIALLFSFGLSEAAFGFDSRGPALQFAALILHGCSAADFAVALLIIIAVVLLPKRFANRASVTRSGPA